MLGNFNRNSGMFTMVEFKLKIFKLLKVYESLACNSF